MVSLGHSVADPLKVDGTYTHDLNKEWEQTGYILQHRYDTELGRNPKDNQ